jgi:type I restriction enzyme M protein
VLSNPPYSVGSFRANLKEYAKDDFELFSKLTEASSEIEALFIERTSQLLKEG